MDARDVRAYLRARQDEMLSALVGLAELESPSGAKVQCDALSARLEERLSAASWSVCRHAEALYGDHLVATWPGKQPAAPPAVLLCHYDTVWPLGTLAQRPIQQRDGRLYGPGVFDMKASVVMLEYGLAAVGALDIGLPRPVVALLTSDEEVGSPSSRALIERYARDAAYVLVLESPLPGGALKTARKGVGRFVVRVEGKAAHAGLEPENGINAIVELARHIPRLDELSSRAHGTTLNVGLVRGGTSRNVVPAHAEVELDVRVWTHAEAERVESALRSLTPIREGSKVRVSGGLHRPPMERTASIAALFERAKAIARVLGHELGDGAAGGASDANLTAALGVATLDGLGALGSGAHADHEYVETASLAERAALLVALLHEL
jgi:glutamate carboxypeptidase